MNVNEIIKEVAKAHNKTPEEVYSEMQIAIDEAFHSQDPEVKQRWEGISIQGKSPTPEEAILFLMGQLKKSNE